MLASFNNVVPDGDNVCVDFKYCSTNLIPDFKI